MVVEPRYPIGGDSAFFRLTLCIRDEFQQRPCDQGSNARPLRAPRVARPDQLLRLEAALRAGGSERTEGTCRLLSPSGFLHVSEQPEAAVAVVRNDVLPFYRKLDLPVAVFTDNGREFCGTEWHPCELYFALNDIEHRKTKVRSRRPLASSSASRRDGAGGTLPPNHAPEPVRECRGPEGRAGTWAAATTTMSDRISATATRAGGPGRRSNDLSDKEAKRTCYTRRRFFIIKGPAAFRNDTPAMVRGVGGRPVPRPLGLDHSSHLQLPFPPKCFIADSGEVELARQSHAAEFLISERPVNVQNAKKFN